LVLIASGIAIPIAVFMMNQWLSIYEYSTPVSWRLFGLTVLGALVLTLLTVSYHTLRVAKTNPVKSLRSE
jgi:putative ABC transport system permease protein